MRAWNWLFFVKVMIFSTVPNLEKIWRADVVLVNGSGLRWGGGLYLVEHIQGDGIEEVLHDDSEDGALSGYSGDASCVCGDGHGSHPTSVQSVDGLQSCLGALGDESEINDVVVSKKKTPKKQPRLGGIKSD